MRSVIERVATEGHRTGARLRRIADPDDGTAHRLRGRRLKGIGSIDDLVGSNLALLVALWGQSARYSSRATPPPLEDGAGPPVRRQRQKQTRLSKEQVDQLVKAYGDGDSVAGLARTFEVNETTVRAHLSRRKMPTRGIGGYRLLHGEMLDRASQLYAAGRSLRSIGSELSLSREAVRSGLVSAGVKIRAASNSSA